MIESGHGKITGKRINDWLITEGYMESAEKNGRNIKIPTHAGEDLGIKSEERIIRGENVSINIFSSAAQRYIVLNTFKIAEHKK